MKISKNFILRSIVDEYVIVPVGDAAMEFNGVISTNATGAFLWKLLQDGVEPELLPEKTAEEFDIGKAEAANDIDEFLNQLKKYNILITGD